VQRTAGRGANGQASSGGSGSAVPQVGDVVGVVHLPGLLSLLEAILDEVHALKAKLSEPSARYLDTAGAALYLGRSEKAIRAAESKGLLKAHRSADGRVLYEVVELDRFATAGDG